MGIKENMEKIRAIMEMEAPCTIKEVQKLIEGFVALNRFVSKATNKCLTLIGALKKAHA